MAFIYVDKLNGLTIVHRDIYGKRSLIVHSEPTPSGGVCILFSSCQMHTNSFEMPPASLLVLDHKSGSVELRSSDTVPSRIRFRESQEVSKAVIA
jgi:hypothetical protein